MATSWSEARIKGFIISVIRAGSRRWPARNEALKAAKTDKKLNVLTNRIAQHYKCNACKKEFPSTQTQVDHIKPVVDPKKGFVDWNTYIDRMFVPVEGYQVLCKKCHSIKTKKETNVRKKTSKN